MTRNGFHFPRRARRALGRRRKGSMSIEAMLAVPTLLVLFSGVTQTMLMAQNRLYLEQAAYAAARSALVHKCPPVNFAEALQSPVSGLQGLLSGSCQDDPRKWEDAARWALIGAAPSSAFAKGRNTCPDLPAARDVLGGGSLDAGLGEAFLNRVCYAYEPGNVTVEVEWETDITTTFGITTPPIRATVTYRYPLTTPFRRFLDDGQRDDGSYWREGSATVVLL
jgi:hypothetical protein